MILISWSLTYPTYLTFALLLWSCCQLLLFSKPFFRVTRYIVVIFAELYLLMQLVYNINFDLDLAVS